jgi:ABC-type branched-subunit amino acid transport system substrate-binding protein
MRVSRGVRRAVTSACAVLLLGVAACERQATSDDGTTPSSVRLYGTDGNMINTFGDEFKEQAGLLAGMKGTTPLTPLSDDFKRRLLGVAPGLGDYVYSGESYDAVVIAVLAAELAGSTKPSAIAKQINGVTAGGEECEGLLPCLTLARQGQDIAYRGVSLKRGGFTDAGEPSTASYATLHFGATDRLDDNKTEYVGAGDATTTTTKPAPAGVRPDGNADDTKTGAPLRIGGLLPKTGDLALAYPPLAAGAALAIKEINDAGGVLGEKVVWREGDDGTSPAVAKRTVRAHINAGVHVIIGAGASGISREVLPDVVESGVILFSPCNTDAGLSSIDDKGLYFRTAPSDLLQGKALADVIMRDGPKKIALVARKDSYGEGLQANTRTELERVGVPTDAMRLLTYEPPEPGGAPLDFTAGAQEIKDFAPDAVVVIGFGESANVIKALVAAGVQLHH